MNNNNKDKNRKNPFRVIEGHKDKVEDLKRKEKLAKQNEEQFLTTKYYHKLIEQLISYKDNFETNKSKKLHSLKIKYLCIVIKKYQVLFGVLDESGRKQATSEFLQGLLNTFQLVSLIISTFTVRELVNLFPAAKIYDGERFGCKDYYYSQNIIKDLGGLDAKIKTIDNAMYFLNEYYNKDILLFTLKNILITNELSMRQGNDDLLTTFMENNELQEDTNDKKDNSSVININDKKKKKEKENNKFKTFYTTSSSEGSNDLMFDSNGDFIGKVVDKKDSNKNKPFWFRKYR